MYLTALTSYAPDADLVRSGAQNLWDAPDFSDAHILSCKKEKIIRSTVNSVFLDLAKYWEKLFQEKKRVRDEEKILNFH